MPKRLIWKKAVRRDSPPHSLIVRPHRPPTANGVVFFTVEDEHGLAHVAVLPDVYQKCGATIYGGGPVIVTGLAEKLGEGVSLLAIATFPIL